MACTFWLGKVLTVQTVQWIRGNPSSRGRGSLGCSLGCYTFIFLH